MGLFDNFINQATGELSTERLLVPPGTYNNCYVRELKVQEGTINSGDRAGQPWAKLLVTWVLDHEELRKELDRSEVVLTQGIMLDVTADGKLDMGRGKNVRLGKFKKALGINDANSPLSDAIQRRAILNVKHGQYNGEPQEEIASVAAL